MGNTDQLGKIVFTANGYDIRQEVKVLEPEKKHFNPKINPTGKYIVCAGKKQVIDPHKDLERLKDVVRAMVILPLPDGFKAKSTFLPTGVVTGYDLIGPKNMNFGHFKGIGAMNKMLTIVKGITSRKPSYKAFWERLEAI